MKRLSALILSALLFLVLTGCGLSLPAPDTAPVILKFWSPLPYEAGPRQLVEHFNQTHPEIQVEYVQYANDSVGNKQLDDALSQRGDVDVCLSDSRDALVHRAASGWFLPLSPLLDKSSIRLDSLYAPGADLFRLDGTYYSLPSRLFNQCILYNEQMFLDKGVPLPRAGWTYEEFLSAAEQLTGDGVYGYFNQLVDHGEPAVQFLRAQLGDDWMYSEDGTSVCIDRPEVRSALNRCIARMEAGIEPDFIDNKTQRMQTEELFLRGKAAMVLDHWTLHHIKDPERYPHSFKVGFATLPRTGGEEQTALYTSTYSDDLSITAQTNHPDEAMTFLLWYITDGMRWLAPLGRVPCTLQASPDDTAAVLFEDSQQFFDLDSARAVYLTSQAARSPRYYTAMQEIQQILEEEFEKAFTGFCSVDEAVKTAQTRAQTAFCLSTCTLSPLLPAEGNEPAG